MMSPKKTARWYELKKKTAKRRTYAEDVEYKALTNQRNADDLAENDLKWKAQLAEAFMASATQQRSGLNVEHVKNVIRYCFNSKSRPLSAEDLAEMASGWMRANQEAYNNHLKREQAAAKKRAEKQNSDLENVQKNTDNKQFFTHREGNQNK